MADQQTEDRIAKIVGLAAAAAATWLAGKVIEKMWGKAFGHTPPKPEDDADDIRFSEVAAAAVITGALVGLFKVAAARGTKKIMMR